MKKNKKSRQKLINFILLIVCALSFLLSGPIRAEAAENVDTGKRCSVCFDIPSAYQEKLKTESISVRLYRIAEITESGRYQSLPGYEKLRAEALSEETTAGELGELADQTASFLGVGNWEDVPATIPDGEFLIQNNEGRKQDLATGLYLVCVKPVTIGNTVYEAMPYIISLPALIGTEGNGTSNLKWEYDLKVDLKLGCKENTPDQEPQPAGPADTKPAGSPVQKTAKTGDDARFGTALAGTIATGAFFILFLYLEKRKRK